MLVLLKDLRFYLDGHDCGVSVESCMWFGSHYLGSATQPVKMNSRNTYLATIDFFKFGLKQKENLIIHTDVFNYSPEEIFREISKKKLL